MAELEELPTLLNDEPWNWEKHLSDREINEIRLAIHYTKRLNHGTAGHNRLTLIAKLATMLDIITTKTPSATTNTEVNWILSSSLRRLQQYINEMTSNPDAETVA